MGRPPQRLGSRARRRPGVVTSGARLAPRRRAQVPPEALGCRVRCTKGGRGGGPTRLMNLREVDPEVRALALAWKRFDLCLRLRGGFDEGAYEDVKRALRE